MLQRTLRLSGNIDFAFLEACDQVVRRQVHQLDGVGTVEYRIRYGLAHANMGDLRDNVVQALDVLDVDGRIDIDAEAQQLFDIEIALWMTAAGRVGVSKLIDGDDLRPARQDGVDVHLVERLPAKLHALARQDFETFEQR